MVAKFKLVSKHLQNQSHSFLFDKIRMVTLIYGNLQNLFRHQKQKRKEGDFIVSRISKMSKNKKTLSFQYNLFGRKLLITIFAFSLLGLISFANPSTTEANMRSDQQQVLNDMQRNSEMYDQDRRMVDDFNRRKAEFESMKRDSSDSADSDKARMSSKVEQMQREFDANGRRLNDSYKGSLKDMDDNYHLDMSSKYKGNESIFNDDDSFGKGNSSNVGQNKSLLDSNANDGRVVRRSNNRVGSASSSGTDNKIGYTESVDNQNKRDTPSKVGSIDVSGDNKPQNEKPVNLSEDNLIKFGIATLLVFIVMSVLYFLGKKRNN